MGDWHLNVREVAAEGAAKGETKKVSFTHEGKTITAVVPTGPEGGTIVMTDENGKERGSREVSEREAGIYLSQVRNRMPDYQEHDDDEADNSIFNENEYEMDTEDDPADEAPAEGAEEKTSDLSAAKAEYDKLTEANNHTEASLGLAKTLGDESAETFLNMVKEKQDELGYMPPEFANHASKLSGELKRRLDDKMELGDVEGLSQRGREVLEKAARFREKGRGFNANIAEKSEKLEEAIEAGNTFAIKDLSTQIDSHTRFQEREEGQPPKWDKKWERQTDDKGRGTEISTFINGHEIRVEKNAPGEYLVYQNGENSHEFVASSFADAKRMVSQSHANGAYNQPSAWASGMAETTSKLGKDSSAYEEASKKTNDGPRSLDKKDFKAMTSGDKTHAIKDLLDEDNHEAALEALKWAKKGEVNSIWHAITGAGFYNQTKENMIKEIEANIASQTKGAQKEFARMNEARRLKSELITASSNVRQAKKGLINAGGYHLTGDEDYAKNPQSRESREKVVNAHLEDYKKARAAMENADIPDRVKEQLKNLLDDQDRFHKETMEMETYVDPMHDKPEAGKQYALTGGSDEPSIAAGNTWAESEVSNDKANAAVSDVLQAAQNMGKLEEFRKAASGDSPGKDEAPEVDQPEEQPVSQEIKDHRKDYDTFSRMYKKIDETVDKANEMLEKVEGISSGPKGLTPASVKQTSEYKNATEFYDKANDLRGRFLKGVPKEFMRRASQERRAEKRAASSVQPPEDLDVAKPKKPLDHGELNIPGRTGNIDRDIDNWKKHEKAKAKQASRDRHQERVDSGKFVNTGSDDAASKLEKRIANKEELRNLKKAVNKALSSVVDTKATRESKSVSYKKGFDFDSAAQAISEKAGVRLDTAQKALKMDFMGRVGFPSYDVTSDTTEIRRLKKQLEKAKAFQQDKAAAKSGADTNHAFDGGSISLDYDDNRLRIHYDDKPDPETITKLKQNGFRWSPRNKAWQAQLTGNAKTKAGWVTGVEFE